MASPTICALTAGASTTLSVGHSGDGTTSLSSCRFQRWSSRNQFRMIGSSQHSLAGTRLQVVTRDRRHQTRTTMFPYPLAQAQDILSREELKKVALYNKGWCRQPWRHDVRKRESRGKYAVTRALPADTYWITAFQAFAVAGLMAGFAVVVGIFINIKIEREAYTEVVGQQFHDLKAKGQLPDEIIIPETGDWDIEEPLYIFQAKSLASSSKPSRNRPVRDEEAPEVKPDVAPELETATLD